MTKYKNFVILVLIVAVWIGSMPVSGQDLVAVSDITGGSSVFVFRNSSRAAPKRFVNRAKPVRTRVDRIETAKRVTRQYETLAKAAPRRVRTEVVTPNDPRVPKIPTMSPGEAAKIFAGVGEYYMNTQEFDRAIEFFRESNTLDKKYSVAQTGLSEALALKGNEVLVKDGAKLARPFFEEALKYNPKNSPAYFGLAEVFSDLDQDGTAVANYEKALLNDAELTEIYVPLGILYYQQGEIAKADSMLSKALAKNPNDAQTQYFYGLVRFSQNKNDEALRAFQKAVDLDPKLAEAYYYLGETQTRLNNNAGSMSSYEKATQLKPDYFEAWLGLGSSYYVAERYPDAVEAYKRAVKLKNDNAEAFDNLGDANRQAGNFNDAEANYNLAVLFLQKKPDYSKQDLADIYSKVGYVVGKQCEVNVRRVPPLPCRWTVAITNLEKAAELGDSNLDNANLGWAYYNSARIDMANRRLPEAQAKLKNAKANLQKAIALNPKFVDAPTLNLGVVLIDLGEFAEAAKVLERVVDKQPDWNFGNYALGTAYYRSDNFDGAAKYFRKAVNKDDKYVSAWSSLGYAELKRNNRKEVEKIISKLQKLNTNEANKLQSQFLASAPRK